MCLLATACGGGGTAPDSAGSSTALSTEAATSTTSTAATTSVAEPAPSTPPSTSTAFTSPVYADPAHWLCHPEVADDACDRTDLDVTVVHPDGSTAVREVTPATDPPIDCFYLYPTVSFDLAPNSDLVPGEEEEFVVANQFARYGRVCRLFAPVYRQITVNALFRLLPEGSPPPDRDLAWADVRDAWRHYLAHDNEGRGVVLVGHSQGTGWLARLIRDEIAPDPTVASLVVAAHLIGTGPDVPTGADTPPGFGDIGICTDADDTACFVAYGTYRLGALPDPSISEVDEGFEKVCVNPADVAGGGPAVSHPVFSSLDNPRLRDFVGDPLGPFADPQRRHEVTTAFYTMPDFIRATCTADRGIAYLGIEVLADPTDPRADDINGELLPAPAFGLHLLDINLFADDLVDLAGRQGAAWLARQGADSDPVEEP